MFFVHRIVMNLAGNQKWPDGNSALLRSLRLDTSSGQNQDLSNRRQCVQETTHILISGGEAVDRAGRHQERERLRDVPAIQHCSESDPSLEG